MRELSILKGLALSLFISIVGCYCGDEVNSIGGDTAGGDVYIRRCKNSAQCNKGEVCSNGYCVDDIEDISEITDITEDIIDDISDAGDGGIDVEVNYIIRLESVYDSNAGVCSSKDYILESITGFTAYDKMKNGQFTLHRSMLFKK